MRPLTGIVVSTKMQKTAVVEVIRPKVHPVYKKRIRVKKKYSAHDEIGVKAGDKVKIQECRPISKTKKWRVIEIVKGNETNKKTKKSEISKKKEINKRTKKIKKLKKTKKK